MAYTLTGLYERAARRFNLKEGKRLFYYSFYAKHRAHALSFLAEMYQTISKAKPTAAHNALASLEKRGLLRRHYTLNIDSLHKLAQGQQHTSTSIWDHRKPDDRAKTVELHGNLREVFCPNCEQCLAMTRKIADAFLKEKDVPCKHCKSGLVRPKVMLYDDADSESITGNEVVDLIEGDVAKADLIMWMGISFEQSASVEYFRKVRRALQESEREGRVIQAIVNPDGEASFNLYSACTNIQVTSIAETADLVLTKILSANREGRSEAAGEGRYDCALRS